MSWKDTLKKYAPSVAGVVGIANPAAGGVISAVSGILLGKPDGTDDEINAALLTMTHEQRLKIAELDNQLKTSVLNAAVRLEELDADSSADARATQRAEMAEENKNWWDSLVDGINRLVRPAGAVGIAAVIGGVVKIPPDLPPEFWNIAFYITIFWYGGRALKKDGIAQQAITMISSFRKKI